MSDAIPKHVRIVGLGTLAPKTLTFCEAELEAPPHGIVEYALELEPGQKSDLQVSFVETITFRPSGFERCERTFDDDSSQKILAVDVCLPEALRTLFERAACALKTTVYATYGSGLESLDIGLEDLRSFVSSPSDISVDHVTQKLAAALKQ